MDDLRKEKVLELESIRSHFVENPLQKTDYVRTKCVSLCAYRAFYGLLFIICTNKCTHTHTHIYIYIYIYIYLDFKFY